MLNSSALPQSKAARTQTIIDLRETFPKLITDQRALDLLEFGEVEEFFGAGTMALRAAQAEEEEILSGMPVEPPDAYEDLMTHWTSHYAKIQNRNFKSLVPQPQKDAMLDHIMVTEMLMCERAQSNPAFAGQVNQLVGFPVRYVPTPEQWAAIGMKAPQQAYTSELSSSQPAQPSATAQTQPPQQAMPEGMPSSPPLSPEQKQMLQMELGSAMPPIEPVSPEIEGADAQDEALPSKLMSQGLPE